MLFLCFYIYGAVVFTSFFLIFMDENRARYLFKLLADSIDLFKINNAFLSKESCYDDNKV